MVHTQDSATYFRVISFTHDSGSFRKKNPPRRQTMPYASYATTLPSSAVDHGCNVCSPKMHSPTEMNLMSVMLLGKLDAVRPIAKRSSCLLDGLGLAQVGLRLPA
ncbi:hypothetical protein ASPTUDRAFT_193136 [Aspergillus tubingensis CBS 134.48]|uniref:Uncharacterized protein n=1 Tax=Aspergillus tubingensis (strain CBS 134.48) TaxID=767770 RepID=A0A1L9MW35_ASPTC|nr:hypothetical protein ASPTUDRAFT_193136 [Aspergillus tubingensis CBS 134.48]